MRSSHGSGTLSGEVLVMDTQLAKNFDPYLAYNKFRINRLLDLMPLKTKPLFYVLTLLLHTNFKGLPGYINDKDAVYGIEKYTFPADLKSSLNTVFPNYPFKGENIGTLP